MVRRNPDFGPDGLRIAFEREGVDCGPGCSYDEIFLVYADGRHLRQLTLEAQYAQFVKDVAAAG